MRLFIMIGSILMFLGVGAGAFGAHGLESYLARYDYAGTYETAVRYHVYHALAIFLVAWIGDKWPSVTATWAGYLFLVGILLFSGSLYLLVFTRAGWLGAITPLGGGAFLAAWALIFLTAWRHSQ